MPYHGLKVTWKYCALFILLCTCQIAQAGFITPSYRGQSNSTYSDWSSSNGIWSNGSQNLNTFTSVAGYPLSQEDGGCGPGQPCLDIVGGDLRFFIPNFVDPLPQKFISIQFRYEQAGVGSGAETQVVEITGSDPAGTVSAMRQSVAQPVIDNGFAFGYEIWRLNPNPDFEFITVSNTRAFNLLEVVIDTISVPEPETLLLVALGFGLLGIVRRKTVGVVAG